MINPEQIRQEVLAIMADTRLWHSQREFKGLTKEQFIDQMKLKLKDYFKDAKTIEIDGIRLDFSDKTFN